MKAFLLSWRTWLFMLLVGAAHSTIRLGLQALEERSTSEYSQELFLVMNLGLLLVGVALLMTLHGYPFLRAFLRKNLNEHGIPVCLKCGYDLRGSEGRRCPECGTESGSKA